MTDKGLREVVAADTQISDIDGDLGRLWYVGYDIADLAQHASYEEVVHLLHHLDLPTRDQLDELNEFLIDERDLSPFLANLMHELAQQTSPMSMLRTGISAASAYDPDGWDESAEAQLRKALRLTRKSPSLITHYHRLPYRTGRHPVEPKLPHAANFLWMLLGEEPSAEDADALDTTFVLYADHTMNASTFTARIIASTLADMFSAITGAVAALKGPLHGGANEEAMKMLEEIGSPDRAEAYVRNRLEHHEKIMGFGHAVYTTMDPRREGAQAAVQRDGRAPRRPPLVRDLGGDRGNGAGAEGPVSERRLLCRERLPRARHPDGSHDADLRGGAHGRLDRARPRAVRGQQGDPARLGVRGAARSDLRADRGPPPRRRRGGGFFFFFFFFFF